MLDPLTDVSVRTLQHDVTRDYFAMAVPSILVATIVGAELWKKRLKRCGNREEGEDTGVELKKPELTVPIHLPTLSIQFFVPRGQSHA